MANIMAVVAVLLINIENSAVIPMSPNMIMAGRVPNGRSNTRAIARSILYLLTAAARAKPPKRITMGDAKLAKIDL